MKNLKNILLFTFVLFLLNSCVVNKPDSSSVSSDDYNTRRIVTNAHFHKKLSATGITLSIGGVALAAYGGYNAKLITYQNGENRTCIKPANAFIGAVVGYSVVSLINHSFGMNNTVNCSDPTKWLKKANRHYLFVRGDYNSFTAINKHIETNYSIRNLQDVKDFDYVFKNSSYTDDIIKKSISNLNRDDLYQVIKIFPSSNSTIDAKKKYVLTSPTLDELITAKKIFPETNIDIEPIASTLVTDLKEAEDYVLEYPMGSKISNVETKAISYLKTLDDIKTFKSIFPRSTHFSEVFKNALTYLNRSDIPGLIITFPNLPEVKDAKKVFLNKSNTVAESIEAKVKYPELYNDAEQKSLTLISNYKDALQFKNAFPTTSNGDKAQLVAVDNCSLNETALLINMFPYTSAIPLLKNKYINKCENIDDCIKAKNLYPDKYSTIEYKAATYVDDYQKMKLFKSEFPNASEDIKSQIFATCIQKDKISNFPYMVKLYPYNKHADEAKRIYIENCKSLSDYKEALNYFPDMQNEIYGKVQDIIKNTTSISECKNIANMFSALMSSADNRAFIIIESVYDCNSYLSYFPGGIHKNEIEQKQFKLKKENFEQYCNKAENNILSGNYSAAKDDISNARINSSGSKDDQEKLNKIQDRYVIGNNSNNGRSNNSNNNIPDGFNASDVAKFSKSFFKKIKYYNSIYNNFSNEALSIKKWDVKKFRNKDRYNIYIEISWSEGTGFDWHKYRFAGCLSVDQFGCEPCFLISECDQLVIFGAGRRATEITDANTLEATQKIWPGTKWSFMPDGCLGDE